MTSRIPPKLVLVLNGHNVGVKNFTVAGLGAVPLAAGGAFCRGEIGLSCATQSLMPWEPRQTETQKGPLN